MYNQAIKPGASMPTVDKNSSAAATHYPDERAVEFDLSVRSIECTVGQEAGKVVERIEIDFVGLTRTVWFKQHFVTADVRVICFDGPYDVGPNDEFVHGYMRVANKLLEIAIGVPASSFAALRSVCAGRDHGQIYLAISPFESIRDWDKAAPLLLREIRFRHELPKEMHSAVGKVSWLAPC